MKPAARILLIALLALVPIAGYADPIRYEVKAGDDFSEVRFHSEATVESFEGWTNHLSGWLEVDISAVSDSLPLEFTVDLASLDTGIALRNRHMRENHLETDEYPLAVFRGAVVLKRGFDFLNLAKAQSFQAEGTLELHGNSASVVVDVSITLVDQAPATLQVDAQFDVALKDFGISRPKFLFMKLAEEQQVRVSFRAIAGEND